MGKEKSDKNKDMDLAKDVVKTDNKLHKNIHRRAFLANQEQAIEYGIQDLKSRISDPKSRFVVPIDAGIGLEDKVLACITKYKLKSKFDRFIRK